MLRLLLIFLPIFIYGNNIVSAGFQNNQFIVEFKRDLIQDEVSDLKQWKKIWFIDVKNSLFKDGFKKYFHLTLVDFINFIQVKNITILVRQL